MSSDPLSPRGCRRCGGPGQADAPLGKLTWFRVGGSAEALVRPSSATDLRAFFAALPFDVPVQVLGAASNVIVRDGGLAGVVVRLARGFNEIEVQADGIVAGAACLDVVVAEHAAAAGLTGLEFLSGIPGSIGGAVAMNAGAYGGEVAAQLDWAEFVSRSGELVRLPAASLALAYRHAVLPAGAVVVRARFWAAGVIRRASRLQWLISARAERLRSRCGRGRGGARSVIRRVRRRGS